MEPKHINMPVRWNWASYKERLDMETLPYTSHEFIHSIEPLCSVLFTCLFLRAILESTMNWEAADFVLILIKIDTVRCWIMHS